MVGYKKPLELRFQSSKQTEHDVQEAAVVLGSAASLLPAATWRGATVVEVGCGSGYVGVLLAALGARVVLTDLASLDSVVSGNISMNLSAIRPPASANFCPLDWTRPRASIPASVALIDAAWVFASDPVVDASSQAAFLTFVKAVLGLDGERPMCMGLEGLIVSHKHQQSLCIPGYRPPTLDGPPSITLAEECSRCSFRLALEDIGVNVADWHAPPHDFLHPFVDCWCLTAAE